MATNPASDPRRTRWQRLREALLAVPHLVREEIWHVGHMEDRTSRARAFRIMRVLALAWDGLRDNRIPSQAAALSYYTLIALGPLIAIAIMVSGFVMPEGGRERIADALTDAVYFVAPSAQQASERETQSFHGANGEADNPEITAEEAEAQPLSELENVIDALVDKSRSGTFGVIGSLVLIFISVQLLSTIEKTFNTIWGVRQSRNFIQQLVFYWAFISLGAVLGVTVLTLGVYSKIAQAFDNIPFGSVFRDSFLRMTPLFIFIAVVCLLAAFNRFIPNARVRWIPALVGSTLVALLLYLNQAASFFYIGFVIRQQSLFGAVGILPVLLFGLFVFWLFLLLGGQLTYAIQNADRLTHQRAWDNASARTKEMLALAALALVARRFAACDPPLSAEELSERIRAPGNLLNHTLSQLVDLGLLSPVEPDPEAIDGGIRYQPGRPLDKLTLAEFQRRLDLRGNNEALPLLEDADPLVGRYRELLLELAHDHPGQITLQSALETSPVARSNAKAG